MQQGECKNIQKINRIKKLSSKLNKLLSILSRAPLVTIVSNKNIDILITIIHDIPLPAGAKKFATSAAKTPGLVGVNKRNFAVKGKNVSINGIKDKEMLQMLTMLAKEMIASV